MIAHFINSMQARRLMNLGGTVATVGFPDIGLQGFAPGKVTGDVWRVT
jgi:hypothetical protein